MQAACLSLLLGLCTLCSAPLGAELRIHDLQGRAHLSPLRGLEVRGVIGVATLAVPDGFFLQGLEPDTDAASSEGIFVYAPESAPPAIGCEVEVGGVVAEFRSQREGLSVTELQSNGFRELRCGVALPAPVRLQEALPAQIDDDLAGSAEAVPPARFEPDDDAIDFYESLEGMRVQLDRARVTQSPDRFGNWWVGDHQASAGRDREPNEERAEKARLRVAGSRRGPLPAPGFGDAASAPLLGVLHYAGSVWELVVGELPSFETHPRIGRREQSRFRGAGALTIATWNLRNLAGNGPSEAFRSRATRIVDALGSPDVIVLQEVQDADGAGSSAGSRGAPTLQRLIDAITRAGGPRYAALQIDPEDGADGGAPHTNIRVAILYDPSRVEHPGAADPAQEASLACRSGRAHLTPSPARIDPASFAFLGSRKPLVASLRFRGLEFKVVALHLSSRRGDDPAHGWAQPRRTPSTARRVAQARVVAAFAREVFACDAEARVIVAGDLNAGPDSPASDVLERSPLLHLGRQLRPEDRYSFVFQGEPSLLDAILISPGLARLPARIDAIHIDTRLPFAEQVSDHDALIARLRLQ